MRLLIRFLVNALAIWLTSLVVSGVQVSGAGGAAVAVIMFSVVNAVIRPIFSLFTFPLQILTLGLFTLVLNGLMFWLAGAIANFLFPGEFVVHGFLAGFFGAIITSLISMVLSILVPGK